MNEVALKTHISELEEKRQQLVHSVARLRGDVEEATRNLSLIRKKCRTYFEDEYVKIKAQRDEYIQLKAEINRQKAVLSDKINIAKKEKQQLETQKEAYLTGKKENEETFLKQKQILNEREQQVDSKLVLLRQEKQKKNDLLGEINKQRVDLFKQIEKLEVLISEERKESERLVNERIAQQEQIDRLTKESSDYQRIKNDAVDEQSRVKILLDELETQKAAIRDKEEWVRTESKRNDDERIRLEQLKDRLNKVIRERQLQGELDKYE